MQTHLPTPLKDTPQGKEADAILRSCVHCGFCLATCPTYQLLGDELDGPRGRIYLIKQALENNVVTRKTQLHLDRCLTCLACETTCPSGVRYGRLLDIGRELVEQQVKRKRVDKASRYLISRIIPYTKRFGALLRMGQWVRWVLPAPLRRQIPKVQRTTITWPQHSHKRTMLILEGCVQPRLAPQINAATARVLDKLHISVTRAPKAGCCGALNHHLSRGDNARVEMRRNIDAWWPHIENGAEAIIITASGCGAHVKEYGHLLGDDPDYADKATRISSVCKDLSEVVNACNLQSLNTQLATQTVAFHSPCSLQHGQGINGLVESILQDLGYRLSPVRDGHLCCGSAGTYSLTQPKLARQLRQNKLNALLEDRPDSIATANIGCLTHLQAGSATPVKHWIELVDALL